jgi:hypothetical protein
MSVVVRAYDPSTDRLSAEEVDRVCEVGPSGTMSLYTDHLGDPLARIRNSPAYHMLVCTCAIIFLYAIVILLPEFQVAYNQMHILVFVYILGCRDYRSHEADCRAGTRYG